MWPRCRASPCTSAGTDRWHSVSESIFIFSDAVKVLFSWLFLLQYISKQWEDIMNVNKVSRTSGHLARFRFLPQVAKTQVMLDICDLAEWQLLAAGAAELICWSHGAQIKTADTYNQDFHQERICPQNIVNENFMNYGELIKASCRFWIDIYLKHSYYTDICWLDKHATFQRNIYGWFIVSQNI